MLASIAAFCAVCGMLSTAAPDSLSAASDVSFPEDPTDEHLAIGNPSAHGPPGHSLASVTHLGLSSFFFGGGASLVAVRTLWCAPARLLSPGGGWQKLDC